MSRAFDTTDSDASDVEEEHAPVPPRNRQGGAVDVAASIRTILVPFEDQSCAACLRGGVNTLLLSVAEAEKHYRSMHKETPAQFQCRGCDKRYEKRHAALCHVPKCPGRREEPRGDHICPTCSEPFSTARGLSTHERIRHPEARNAARAAGIVRHERVNPPPEMVPSPPRRVIARRVFSEQDVAIMLQCELRFRGDVNMAMRMRELLPNKTLKQLRDKRREATYVRRRDLLYAQRVEELQGVAAEPPRPRELAVVLERIALADPPQPPPLDQVAEPVPIVLPEIAVEEVADFSRTEEFLRWKLDLLVGVQAINANGRIGRKEAGPEAANTIRALRGCLSWAADTVGEIPQYMVDHTYQLALDILVRRSEDPDASTQTRGEHPRRSRGRKRVKRYIYSRTQGLYAQNPGLLAKMVRKGIDWMSEPGIQCPDAAVEALYRELWESNPGVVQFEEAPAEQDEVAMGHVLSAITPLEVLQRVRRLKKDVAAGVDGIRKKDLNHPAAREVLRLVFNFLLIAGKQPRDWRMNRTTLLLKEGKDGRMAENYRPITISSLVSRVYYGILDAKIRSVVTFSPRQKGFVSEPGCFRNVHVLNELLRHAKAHTGLVLTQLDVSKAFDTVPHEALGPALRSKGLPDHIVRIVDQAYTDVDTSIDLNKKKINVRLQRGVKQGDPLSPTLFNVVCDKLLRLLESREGYRLSEDNSISCLAFADDLLLVASSEDVAQRQLEDVERFFSGLGMSLSAPKCCTFQIKTTKDSWFLADPHLHFDSGLPVRALAAGEGLDYLGMVVNPWSGIDMQKVSTTLLGAVKRVRKLTLKPFQKLDLIATYLIPHYQYAMSIAIPGVTWMRNLDQELRVQVREIMHLPQSVTDHVIYCRRRDGGLGFPRLEWLATAGALKAGTSFLNADDPAMRALGAGSQLDARLRKLCLAQRLHWPPEEAVLKTYVSSQKRRALSQWSQLGSQGKSVRAFTDSAVGNAWLMDNSLLKPCRAITALKMRTNSCANRAAMSRAIPMDDVSCRLCRAQTETLGHILGYCEGTKTKRIRRHDEIVHLLRDDLARQGPEVAVAEEPRLVLDLPGAGNLRPDLVVKSHGRVFVVDVTVRHEDGRGLEQGRLQKISKYRHLLPQLAARFHASAAEVLPIVVGTRGALPRETAAALTKLGIRGRRTQLTMSLIALRSSIEIYHAFMDDVPLPRRRLRQPP